VTRSLFEFARPAAPPRLRWGIQTVHRARHLFREHCLAIPRRMAHTRMVLHFLGFPARAERAKAKPADHATDQSKCTLHATVQPQQ